MDLKVWECGIPGKEKTMWEGGMFKMTMTFPDGMFSDPGTSPLPRHRRCRLATNTFGWNTEYPTKPPKCEYPTRAAAAPVTGASWKRRRD